MSSNNEKSAMELISSNYQKLNKMMSEEIDMASSHDGVSGSNREVMWMNFFRNIIPLKYSLAQGVIIIDSENRRSSEVDIAVYDEQYTPYVFQYNTLKFIPIEAVAIVIECKSKKLNIDDLELWANSIKKLQPVPSGLARIFSGFVTGDTNTMQPRTRPIRILASNFQRVNNSTLSKTVKGLEKSFDFILLKQLESSTTDGGQEYKLKVPFEDNTLGWWGRQLNGIGEAEEIGKGGHVIEALKQPLSDLRIPNNDLLSLNFQLNQLLMLINNPMLFPHFAYARTFAKLTANSTEVPEGSILS
ncbi:hypothetical protein J2Z69_000104 [Paenibacillus shirakamiensis]|uniref:DUF6602 domain-containing protein n=1 Tax=Paenibacillus shirakamiensis TaxID=1265935 RepID=A0ABS4JBJ4_9BACL|nr:DUF6602 domain-containing protein [Paenibacillus shirakamiensis]MBP1999085.1 hypothetical protein [Paenibacillus shirakamiensis]